jgi:hypothetical protein
MRAFRGLFFGKMGIHRMVLEDARRIAGRFLHPLGTDEFLDRALYGGFAKIDGNGGSSVPGLLGSDPAATLLGAFQLAPKLSFHSANPSGEPPSLLGITDSKSFRQRIEQFHAKHYSVRFPELRPLSPPLDHLARAFEVLFHQPVTASAFWSRGGMRAPVHCDDHDLIVAQLRGTKRWYVSKTPSELNNTWKTTPKHAARLDSHATVDLRPGDRLYLPRGTLHSVDSNEESLHLAIGFTPLTVREALIAAVDHLSDLDRNLRMTLGGRLAWQLRGQGLEHTFPPVLAGLRQLVAACNSPGFLAAALQRRSARAVAALGPARRDLLTRPIDLDTPLVHAESSFCHLTADSENIDFSYPGGHEYIHLGARECVVYIVNTPAFRPREIPGPVDDEVRLSLATKFLELGFLRLAANAP